MCPCHLPTEATERKQTMADGDTITTTQSKQLSPKEIAQCKDELVEKDMEIDQVLSEKQASNAAFSERMKPLKKRRSELLKAIDTGETELEVEAREVWDYKRNVVQFRSVHSNELLEERDMDDEELQESLPIDGASRKAKA